MVVDQACALFMFWFSDQAELVMLLMCIDFWTHGVLAAL
jgi:hypothetical protein